MSTNHSTLKQRLSLLQHLYRYDEELLLYDFRKLKNVMVLLQFCLWEMTTMKQWTFLTHRFWWTRKEKTLNCNRSMTSTALSTYASSESRYLDERKFAASVDMKWETNEFDIFPVYSVIRGSTSYLRIHNTIKTIPIDCCSYSLRFHRLGSSGIFIGSEILKNGTLL